MAATQRRRRLMAEINVVPYIDVMLVLLIIFMITSSCPTPARAPSTRNSWPSTSR
jgi:biopolymer transport protein ExbD